MKSKTNYVFDHVDILVNFLLCQSKKSSQLITPLKLQKSLYFLYAFYAGMMINNVDVQKSKTENNQNNVPKELFPAQFEAWTYGPVIKDVYVKYKGKEYEKTLISFDIEETLKNIPNSEEIVKFIENLFQKICSVSDLTLMAKAQSDVVWQDAFNSESKIIKNENIWNEYKKKFE
jgi:hypothetical protein